MATATTDGRGDVLEEALRLRRLGVSVIPIAVGTKEPPMGFAWGAYAHRLADVSELHEWFMVNRWQIAVVTGPASSAGRHVILDFDGLGGFESLATLHPEIRAFPRVLTGSGKTHVHFISDRPVAFGVTKAPDGSRLEIRTGVHYTLAPGSMHPDTGKMYTWVVEPSPDGFPIYHLAALGLDPGPAEARDRSPFREGPPLTEIEESELIRILADHWTAGQRHNLSLAVAGFLAGHGIPSPGVLALLKSLASPEDNWRKIRQAVLDTYRKSAQGVAVTGWSALAYGDGALLPRAAANRLQLLMRYREPAFAFEPVTPAQEPSKAPEPAPASQNGASDTVALPEASPVLVKPRVPWIVGYRDFMALRFPEPVNLIDGLLVHPSVVILAGPPKVYKSFLAIEAAIAVATGTRFLGSYFTGPPRNAAIIQEESSTSLFQRRLACQQAGRGLTIEQLEGHLFLITNQGFRLDSPNAIAQLREVVEQHHIELVAYDPLVEMHAQDENTAEMRLPLGVLRQLRDNLGCSSLVVHHNGKNPAYTRPQESMRGWSGIWGMMDGGWFVRDLDRDHEKRIQVVLRDGKPAEPFMLRAHFDDDAYRFDAITLGAGATPLVAERDLLGMLADLGWATPEQIGEALGMSTDTARRRLVTLAKANRLRVKTDPDDPHHRRQMYAAKRGDHDDDPDF